MSFVQSFSVLQSAITPSTVRVTDTSTGTDASIYVRRVYVSDAYGNFLTGSGSVHYDTWALVDTYIDLAVLTEDTAANIQVDWVSAGGTVLYTTNGNYPLSEFGKQFFFYLVQLQGLTPGVYQDSNYVGNLVTFWANVVGGNNAVTSGNSISAAQNCYNREIEMMNNQSLYF